MDISITPSVVEACMDGIDRAYDLSHKLKREIKIRPFIMVSNCYYSHRSKEILYRSDLCAMCGFIVAPVCPTDAIEWGGQKHCLGVNQ